jgi:hypothetical protein
VSVPFKFDAAENPAALVIVFPPGMKGLFNAEIHGLVREVQEKLDGVYVTYALSSGTSPNLRDAISAARFIGCDSAVVVPAAASAGDELGDHVSAGDWMLTTPIVQPELDAPAVINAYLTAVDEAGRAA